MTDSDMKVSKLTGHFLKGSPNKLLTGGLPPFTC